MSNIIVNKNIPYAIRIDGTFGSLKLRSLRKQNKPYPPLAQASEEQAIFDLKNVKGSIVGFWFPQYWAGIAVPGYHLHFVTQDRKTGGHVLEINLVKGQVSMEPLYQIQVHLPNTQSFAQVVGRSRTGAGNEAAALAAVQRSKRVFDRLDAFGAEHALKRPADFETLRQRIMSWLRARPAGAP